MYVSKHLLWPSCPSSRSSSALLSVWISREALNNAHTADTRTHTHTRHQEIFPMCLDLAMGASCMLPHIHMCTHAYTHAHTHLSSSAACASTTPVMWASRSCAPFKRSRSPTALSARPLPCTSRAVRSWGESARVSMMSLSCMSCDSCCYIPMWVRLGTTTHGQHRCTNPSRRIHGLIS
jgi:hypothetical protein